MAYQLYVIAYIYQCDKEYRDAFTRIITGFPILVLSDPVFLPGSGQENIRDPDLNSFYPKRLQSAVPDQVDLGDRIRYPDNFSLTKCLEEGREGEGRLGIK